MIKKFGCLLPLLSLLSPLFIGKFGWALTWGPFGFPWYTTSFTATGYIFIPDQCCADWWLGAVRTFHSTLPVWRKQPHSYWLVVRGETKTRKMSGEKQDHLPPPQQMVDLDQPPPDYDEVMAGPLPLPGPMGSPPVFQKPLGGLPGVEFGPEPVQLSCWSCHRQVIKAHVMQK